MGGAEEAADVYPRRRPKQHAIGIYYIDAAIAGNQAVDLRRAKAAGHAVKRDGGGPRLKEPGCFAGRDVEGIPVDHRAGRGLVNGYEACPLPLDRRSADGNLAAKCWLNMCRLM